MVNLCSALRMARNPRHLYIKRAKVPKRIADLSGPPLKPFK